MSEATTSAIPTLIPLGDPDAVACEGDACVIPDHHSQAQVNRQLDADLV